MDSIFSSRAIASCTDLFDLSFGGFPASGFDKKAFDLSSIPLVDTYSNLPDNTSLSTEDEPLLEIMMPKMIAAASPFDIFEPHRYNTSIPYIVISFAPDTMESQSAIQANSRPDPHAQDGSSLVVPEYTGMRPYTNEELMEMETPDIDIPWWNPTESDYLFFPYVSEPNGLGSWGTSTEGLLDTVLDLYPVTSELWKMNMDEDIQDLDKIEVEDWSAEYVWTDEDECMYEGMGMGEADDSMESEETEIDGGMSNYELDKD